MLLLAVEANVCDITYRYTLLSIKVKFRCDHVAPNMRIDQHVLVTLYMYSGGEDSDHNVVVMYKVWLVSMHMVRLWH